MSKEVRCPNCNKKWAERLEGILWVFCKGCKELVRLEISKQVDIAAGVM